MDRLPFDFKPQTTRITSCHCEACKVTVHVNRTPPPVACPYCQRPFVQSEAEMPLALRYCLTIPLYEVAMRLPAKSATDFI